MTNSINTCFDTQLTLFTILIILQMFREMVAFELGDSYRLSEFPRGLNFAKDQGRDSKLNDWISSNNGRSYKAGNQIVAPNESKTTNEDLQSQFNDMLDWNKDLGSDPRFKFCKVPDIQPISEACPKREFYYGMHPSHLRAVQTFAKIIAAPNNTSETLCLAGATRDSPHMNPNVWIRGLLAARASNDILHNLKMPPLVEILPCTFIKTEALREVKAQASFSPENRTCVVIDGTAGKENGVENRLWYWREDVLLNAFHVNWHLTYPYRWEPIRADRRGELFYFTHHSHVVRYHAERLSNGLGQVVPLHMVPNAVVPEPYYPHLQDTNSGMKYSPRPPNRILQDALFEASPGGSPNITLLDRLLHLNRIEESIFFGRLLMTDGQTISLNSFQGIDLLADVIEASINSVNPDYYGRFGVHNEGHDLLAVIEDPGNLTGTPQGVLGEATTAMRDPAFYTYHAALDLTFDRHKRKFRPYQREGGYLQLSWPGVEISNVYAKSDDTEKINILKTYFTHRTFDLSRGLDFNRSGIQGPITACVTHLDHIGFEYIIKIQNRNDFETFTKTSVRIFLAPRFDEYGRRYTIFEQRRLFFMMDLFTTNRQNIIRRKSTESSLTIQIPQGLQEVQKVRADRQKYCGCGWPHHLLLPKGTKRGIIFDLFVMLTDGKQDHVPSRRRYDEGTDTCRPAPIYCGRLNDTYPDARPMGYPFDRLPYNVQNINYGLYLNDFVNGIRNMATTQVTITHAKILEKKE